jgi:tRNA-2-methylthio-N6-dimethylallyladenosine synthase
MNVYDTVRMHDVLTPLGYTASDTYVDADMVILNTCHIREKADDKVYSDLGRIRAEKEKKKSRGEKMLVAVGGCVGQAEGAEIIKRAHYVDMVFGPQSYHQLPEMVTRAIRDGGGVVELDFASVHKFDQLPEVSDSQGVSAFLSVQEGCDKFCHFCVVPYTRGAEYSRPFKDIMVEAKKLVDGGAKEITLLGQNVNAYHGSTSLAGLIDALAQINGLERIRYMTSHPRDMSDDLIAIHGSEKKLMPFLHLPVQSGSNEILKKMNRKHERDLYFEIIEKLRKSCPDIALSSDFIVGFPAETDENFEDTMDLIRRIGYASVYSFKYSPRPGTPAAISEEQVEELVKQERLARLQALVHEQQTAFNQSFVGKTIKVLFDRDGKFDGQLLGKGEHLQSAYVKGDASLRGTIADVKITAGFLNSVTGEVVK